MQAKPFKSRATAYWNIFIFCSITVLMYWMFFTQKWAMTWDHFTSITRYSCTNKGLKSFFISRCKTFNRPLWKSFQTDTIKVLNDIFYLLYFSIFLIFLHFCLSRFNIIMWNTNKVAFPDLNYFPRSWNTPNFSSQAERHEQ